VRERGPRRARLDGDQGATLAGASSCTHADEIHPILFRLRGITMKKAISFCLSILSLRAPVLQHEEESDLLQRLREAGL
jgi:hypothetical protein